MYKAGKTIHQKYAIYISSMLLVCTLLLSACTGGGAPSATSTPTARPTSTPGISNALQSEGAAQLQNFQHWITLMLQYGGDATSYQQQYASDQQALKAATSGAAYSAALDTLKGHVTAIQTPALKVEIANLRQKLIDGAAAWGQAHSYHDPYDGKTYPFAFEYGANGLANYPAQDLLSKADASQKVDDYQYLADQENIWLANFQAYQTNFTDQTPYNQVHATDTQLMQQNGDMTGKTIVVSLSEQAMRVYQDGQLLKAFHVITGMPEHPSLPGAWWVETRQTNIHFDSGVQPGQPGYYTPVTAGWGMQYHSDGYFLHEAWWRHNFGPLDQFPHGESYGPASGSHGCVNMQTPDVQWLYNFVDILTTNIIIY